MDGRKFWIIANWKSNKTVKEALDWISIVGPVLPHNENLKIVVCPPFSCLSEMKKAITQGGFPILLGSQDLSPFEKGAYTGEESAELLKDLVDLSILGHSERRKNFGETDELIARKFIQAKTNGIIPLVCVQDEHIPVPMDCQLIAYEPVWAIGTGNPDTPEGANTIANIFKTTHPTLQVLYGGSVNSSNVKSFLDQPEIDGVLIGNASLDAQEFIKICNLDQ